MLQILMNALNGLSTAQLRYDVEIQLALTNVSVMKACTGSITDVKVTM
jgi:hypothetical protein